MLKENTFDREKLEQLILRDSSRYNKLKKLNQSLNIGISLLGIGLSLGATISGILNKDARIAAIFGACAATTQAILFAYPTDKRARAYRSLLARNENLQAELEVRPQTEQELQKILDEFKMIRVQASLEESMFKRSENLEEMPSLNSDESVSEQAEAISPSSPAQDK
jgi:hypothetical protein